MYRRVALGMVGFLLVVATLGGASTQPAAGATPAWDVETQQSFETTTYELTVYANGSTRWTVEYSRPLENDTERERYRTFADEFANGTHPIYERFRNTTGRLLGAGRNATDREMHARNFSRQAYVTPLQNRGVLRMSFTWTAFARVRDDRVVLSDVFDGGFYVGPGQRLVVRNGTELRFASVEPSPDRTSGRVINDSESVTWIGERLFTDEHPHVEFRRTTTTTPTAIASGTSTTESSTTERSTTATTTTAVAGGDPVGMVMVGLLVLAIGLGGAALWRSNALGTARTADSTTRTSETASTTAPNETTRESSSDADAPDVLSDTDRVLRMLEANDGRMKQVDIVDGTEWSKSKVSMLLSDMEDDDLISKLRVGRENIISLKGSEPDAAGSPFDDEE